MPFVKGGRGRLRCFNYEDVLGHLGDVPCHGIKVIDKQATS